MFDDHIPQKPTNTPQGGGQAPANLPFAEPEDVFADVEPSTPDVPATAETNTDVPSTQSALGAGVLKPASQAAPADMPVAAPPQPPKQSVPVPPRPQIPDGLQGTVPEPPAPPDDMLAVLDDEPATEPAMPATNETTNSVSLPNMAQTQQDAPQIQNPAPVPGVTPPAAPPTPAMTPPAAGTQMPPQLPQDESYRIKEPTLSRGIMGSIIAAVVVLILGGGGWWIYHAVVADVAPTNGGIDTPTTPTEPAADLGQTEDTGGTAGTVTTELPPINIDDAVLFGLPADSDGDGLDDEQEATLGLDPKDWDSDDDELSDGDEVIIWETDPNNPDTDGDTFKDGTEVKAGYNPRGPGRIFEAPALENTTANDTVAPPVIGGTELVSSTDAVAVIDIVIETSPYQAAGNCPDAQVDSMVRASVDVITAQGYTVEAGVWEDEIVGPLLMTEVEQRMEACTATATTTNQ